MKNFQFIKITAFVLLVVILMPSCASIFSKSSYPVAFSSQPSGAEITVTNKKGEQVFAGRTPITIPLDASSKYMSGERLTVTISKDGYEAQTVVIGSKIEPWYWANILLGGLIGMLIVDPLTGAMYKIDTKSVDVTLDKANEARVLEIIDINSLSAEQRQNLVRTN